MAWAMFGGKTAGGAANAFTTGGEGFFSIHMSFNGKR